VGEAWGSSCDPQNWSVEINRQECRILPLKHALSSHMRERCRQLAPQFRAYSGRFEEEGERVGNPATRWLGASDYADGEDHHPFGQCDPRNWPVEINRQESRVLLLKRAFSGHVRENRRQLVAQFRASSGRFDEDGERVGNPAERPET